MEATHVDCGLGRVFLQQELTYKQPCGRRASASWVHFTEAETPNTSKYSLMPLSCYCDAFAHLHAGTSAKVWLLLTWIQRERTKNEKSRDGRTLLTRSAKIHDSTERGTEEQREAVRKDRGSAMLTWCNLAVRAPSDHTPPICSDWHLLDKNHSLHSSLHRTICRVQKDLQSF